MKPVAPILTETIDMILNGVVDRGSFTPGRYPFTYAYDFFRSHSEFFGETGALSRADASGAVARYAEQIGMEKFDVALALADAYLTEWNIHPTQAQKEQALAHQRHVAWKACGLSEPGPATDLPN